MLPKTTFTILDGNLGNLPLRASAESGLLFYNDNVTDLTIFTATSRVHKFNALNEVEAAGITSASTNFQAEHYQISEYFRMGGTELWIGIFAIPAGTYDFTEIADMALASGGGIRQYGILAQADTLTSANVALIQAELETLNTGKQSAIALYGADTGTITMAGLFDLRNLSADAEFVTSVIGQDMENVPFTISTATSNSLPNLGAPLGLLSSQSVSTNILYIDKFNYSNGIQMVNTGFFLNDGADDNQFIYTDTIATATLDAVNDKGYMFWRYLANKNGTYLSNDNNSTAITSDYNQISLVRIMNESVRLVDAQVSGLLGAPVRLDESGTLTGGSKQLYTAAVNRGLSYLINENDITNFSSVISYTVATKTIKIQLSLQPAFSTSNISVEIGYAVTV